MIDFDGQAVIVTGSGRGLGRLYAMEMARRGAQVVINDIGVTYEGADPDPGIANAVVDEIQQAGGIALASHDSVDSPDGGAAIVQTALDAFGSKSSVPKAPPKPPSNGDF